MSLVLLSGSKLVKLKRKKKSGVGQYMSFFWGGTYSFASSGTTGVKGGLWRPHITEQSDTRDTGVEAQHKRPAQGVTDKIATAGA